MSTGSMFLAVRQPAVPVSPMNLESFDASNLGGVISSLGLSFCIWFLGFFCEFLRSFPEEG